MFDLFLQLLVLLNLGIGLANLYLAIRYENKTNPFDALDELRKEIDSIEDEKLRELVTNIVNCLLENRNMALLLKAIVYIAFFVPILNIFFLVSHIQMLKKQEDDIN